MLLKTTQVEFSRTRLETRTSSTISQSLDGVLKTVSNIGPLETPGVLTSEKMDLLESLEVSTISLSKQTALGPHQKIPGQRERSTSLPKLRKMIQETSQLTLILFMRLISSRKREDAELLKLVSNPERSHLMFHLG